MRVETVTRNTGLNAITARCNSGYIRFYSGTRPANAQTAITSQTLLATCRFGATAFVAAVNGVATANSISADGNAVAAGTCSFVRLFMSDGTTVIADLSAGTSGTEVILNTTTFDVGLTMQIWNFTLTLPDGS